MADHHDAAPAVMDDQAELVEPFIIGDQAVRALEGIVMGLAMHFEGRLHRFAAERGRVGMLGARHQETSMTEQASGTAVPGTAFRPPPATAGPSKTAQGAGPEKSAKGRPVRGKPVLLIRPGLW